MSFVGIKFCQECNNMLYPQEDTEKKILLYVCRQENCNYSEVADSPCIYTNNMTKKIGVGVLVVDDIIYDPTLPRDREKNCSNCGNQESVYFQSQYRREDSGMRLYYVCVYCKHRWTNIDEKIREVIDESQLLEEML